MSGTAIQRIRQLDDEEKVVLLVTLLVTRFDEDDEAIKDYLDGFEMASRLFGGVR